jgi:hypothetical protein
VLAWRATPGPAARVDVTLAVGGRDLALPPLPASGPGGVFAPGVFAPGRVFAPDPGPGDPSACTARHVDELTSELTCGGNGYYAAELHPNGELVITLVTTDVGCVIPWLTVRKEVAHVAAEGDVVETVPFVAR